MDQNSEFVRTVAERFLVHVIHELDSTFNPKLVNDYGTPEECKAAERWWGEVGPITDELFAVYNKMDNLIEKMKGN